MDLTNQQIKELKTVVRLTMGNLYSERLTSICDELLRLRKERESLIVACEGLIADDMLAAHETIEYGPGGTSEEFAAEKLINDRREEARVVIAEARRCRALEERA